VGELDATDIRVAVCVAGAGGSSHPGMDPPHQSPHGVGKFCLQRGFNPRALNDWFVDVFVDGTPWVMPANVIGMSQYADGGQVATKPYTSGGAYLNTMTNYCGSCVFKPHGSVGEKGCP
jgi:deoxyribodipyrimidine photolyase-related protein